MTFKVGSKPTTTTKTEKPVVQKTQQQQPKPTVPMVQKGNTTTHIVNTNGTPTEVVTDGNSGGMTINVMGDCNECSFTTINDRHVEVTGDNNGQITTGDQSPVIITNGNNSPVGVTYGDGSDVNQATGKKAQITDETVINNIQQAPVEDKPAVKQETIDALKKMGIPQEDIERLTQQDEYVQSHLKDNMTSLRSEAIIANAKIQKAENDEEVTAAAEAARFPASLDDLMAEGSKFKQLPKATQEVLLKSGLPAGAITDIMDAGYAEFVKFDNENKILKVANGENGTMLEIDTSRDKFTQNMQIGREYTLEKDKDGKNKLNSRIKIDGANVKLHFGFDPIKEFEAKNGGYRSQEGMNTEFVLGERTKISGMTFDRYKHGDKVTFAKTKATNYLNGEKPSNIVSNFDVHYTGRAKHTKRHDALGYTAHSEELKEGDKITYRNYGDSVPRIEINKTQKVTTSQSYM